MVSRLLVESITKTPPLAFTHAICPFAVRAKLPLASIIVNYSDYIEIYGKSGSPSVDKSAR